MNASSSSSREESDYCMNAKISNSFGLVAHQLLAPALAALDAAESVGLREAETAMREDPTPAELLGKRFTPEQIAESVNAFAREDRIERVVVASHYGARNKPIVECWMHNGTLTIAVLEE